MNETLAFWKEFGTVVADRGHPLLGDFQEVHGNKAYREFSGRMALGFRPRAVFLGPSDELRAELFSNSATVWEWFDHRSQVPLDTTLGGSTPNLYATSGRSGVRIDLTLRGAGTRNVRLVPALALWLSLALEDLLDSFDRLVPTP